MEVLFLLAMLAMGAVNAVCFLIGAKIGLAVAKGEEVNLIPAKAVEVHPVQPEEDAEKKSRLDIIKQNIDNYNGTEQGQVDVPWR